jgi:hypothetical protein
MHQMMISKRDFDGVITSLEWALEQERFFYCNCEPHYESDTNATIHADGCAVFMQDHLEITLENTKAAQEKARPVIVCLCGSTRFWRTFQEAGLKETLAGRIVLSIGAASGTDDDHFGNLPREEYDRVKEMLDQLHLRKIDLADEVLILNVDGYVGPSTSRELAYARGLGKTVRFWEEVSRG